MSSTNSPISSGPNNAGTHIHPQRKEATRSLYFRMIPAWRVGEIEFQCCLARFVISKRVGIEVSDGDHNELKGKYDEFGGKTRCAPEEVWPEAVRGGQGEC